jgi:hypothetical protein
MYTNASSTSKHPKLPEDNEAMQSNNQQNQWVYCTYYGNETRINDDSRSAYT